MPAPVSAFAADAALSGTIVGSKLTNALIQTDILDYCDRVRVCRASTEFGVPVNADGDSRAPDPARMRVLIATELGASSASTRYRALQFVPGLRQRFAEVTVSLPDDDVFRAPGRLGQINYFATHARRYGRRWHTLPRHLDGVDTLFVQRGLYPLGPSAITRSLRDFSGRLVLDFDDAVLSLRPTLANRSRLTQWLYDAQQTRALLDRADAVIVSSEDLAASLDGKARDVTLLTTVPNPANYPLAPGNATREDGLVIGWAGTNGSIPFLEPLREVFERLRRERVARLEVVSSVPWNGPSDFHRWTLAEESTVFQRFDIGIMPLPDTPYTRSKAAFKLLQCMAAGLPVVASPIGVNRELIEESGAGIAASTPEEWESAFRTLASDPRIRAEFGARARAFIESYADIDGHLDTLAKVLAGD